MCLLKVIFFWQQLDLPSLQMICYSYDVDGIIGLNVFKRQIKLNQIWEIPLKFEGKYDLTFYVSLLADDLHKMFYFGQEIWKSCKISRLDHSCWLRLKTSYQTNNQTG